MNEYLLEINKVPIDHAKNILSYSDIFIEKCSSKVYSIASCETYILISYKNSSIEYWNINTGILENRFFFEKGPLRIVGFSLTNNMLIVSSPCEINILEPFTDKIVKTMTFPSHNVFSLKVSFNAKYLIAIFFDNIQIWGLQKIFHKKLNLLLSFLAIFHDDNFLYISTKKNLIDIWDIEKNKKSGEFVDPSNYGDFRVFASDKNFLVAANEEHELRIWSIESKNILRAFKAHSDTIFTVKITEKSEYIISGGDDGVKIWSTFDFSNLFYFKFLVAVVLDALITSDYRYLILSGKNRVAVHDFFNSENKIIRLEVFNYFSELNLLDNGTYLMTSNQEREIKNFDLTSFEEIKFNIHEGRVTSLIYDPLNHVLVSGGTDSIRFWDLNTKKQILVFKGHKSKILSLGFTNNMNYTISLDETEIRVYKYFKL